MRRTKRPSLVALVILAILAAITASCGAEASSDQGVSEANDSEAAPAGAGEQDPPPEANGSGEKTEITILGTLKPEVAEQFEQAMAAYNASQDLYEISSVPLPVGRFMETASAMYASGNAPTIMVLSQEIPVFKDRLLDLSGTTAATSALPGMLDAATVDDDRVIGVPQTIEAFGLLYNQDVLDDAVGGTFDPATIETRSDLLAVFEQVDSLDRTEAAVHVSPVDWSLGAHLTNPLYATQSEDAAERVAFIESLKAGQTDLAANPGFTGWLDTVDSLLAANQLAASPLSATYEDGVAALANGDVGFWFMGSWASPDLLAANPDGEFGIMPLPVSDTAGDFGNRQVSLGVSAYLAVDAEQASEAEQAGGVDFINWLTTTDEGLRFYTDEFRFIPAYDTVTEPPDDLMSRQIVDYEANGQTLEWVNSSYPPNGWPTFAATMEKYLSGNTDRAGVASEFADYWTTVD